MDKKQTRAIRRTAMLTLLAVATACGPAPQSDETPAGTAPEASAVPPAAPGSLKAIMQGLEADLANVAHGIWAEDAEAVGAAAGRVADHPRVTPEQMAVIQATLGEDFAAFVQYDQAVHRASVALAEGAAGATAVEHLSGLQRIQQGCVSCHSAFRTRVSAALNPPGT
jgi:hypothetical protein